MAQVKKLSVDELTQIIKEEFGKMKEVEKEAKNTKEVDAEDLADTVTNKIDHMKALQIKEGKLTKIYSEAKKALLETRKQIANLKSKTK